jgi:hypothetical protein
MRRGLLARGALALALGPDSAHWPQNPFHFPSNFVYSVKYSINLFELSKFIEICINLRRMQNKICWNHCE